MGGGEGGGGGGVSSSAASARLMGLIMQMRKVGVWGTGRRKVWESTC